VTVGFFGKVRSHGDFVSRRLPPEMVQPFDAWIQAWLVQSKLELGADWLPVWSSSPLWRFVLAPGVCGPQAWTGVMMPSADRVGRCFPLVLAASLAEAPSLRECVWDRAAWHAQLEELALSSLEEGFFVDAFDVALEALDALPPPAVAAACSVAQGSALVIALCNACIPESADAGLAGQSVWWTDGSCDVAPCLAICMGLPATASAVALLDGRWLERGWQIAYASNAYAAAHSMLMQC
jgi:type VI secretion system protein ImpM